MPGAAAAHVPRRRHQRGARPFSVATFQVPEKPGDFCSRRRPLRSATRPTSRSRPVPLRQARVPRLLQRRRSRGSDVRDPFRPHEAGYFIPATTSNTDKRCVDVGGTPRCKVAIQTNNVEIDDRGLIYLADPRQHGPAHRGVHGRAPLTVGPLTPTVATRVCSGYRACTRVHAPLVASVAAALVLVLAWPVYGRRADRHAEGDRRSNRADPCRPPACTISPSSAARRFARSPRASSIIPTPPGARSVRTGNARSPQEAGGVRESCSPICSIARTSRRSSSIRESASRYVGETADG